MSTISVQPQAHSLSATPRLPTIQDHYYRLKMKYDAERINKGMNGLNLIKKHREYIIYYKLSTLFIRPMGIFHGCWSMMNQEFRSFIPYNRIRKSIGEIGWLPMQSDDKYLKYDYNYLIQTNDRSKQISALIMPKSDGQVSVMGETYYGFNFDSGLINVDVDHGPIAYNPNASIVDDYRQNYLEIKGNISIGQYLNRNGWEIEAKPVSSDFIVEIFTGRLSVIIGDFRSITLIPDLNCKLSLKLLFSDDDYDDGRNDKDDQQSSMSKLSEIQISGLDLLQQKQSAADKLKSIEDCYKLRKNKRQQQQRHQRPKRSKSVQHSAKNGQQLAPTASDSLFTKQFSTSTLSGLLSPIAASPPPQDGRKTTEHAVADGRQLPKLQPIPAPITQLVQISKKSDAKSSAKKSKSSKKSSKKTESRSPPVIVVVKSPHLESKHKSTLDYQRSSKMLPQSPPSMTIKKTVEDDQSKQPQLTKLEVPLLQLQLQKHRSKSTITESSSSVSTDDSTTKIVSTIKRQSSQSKHHRSKQRSKSNRNRSNLKIEPQLSSPPSSPSQPQSFGERLKWEKSKFEPIKRTPSASPSSVIAVTKKQPGQKKRRSSSTMIMKRSSKRNLTKTKGGNPLLTDNRTKTIKQQRRNKRSKKKQC